VLPHVTRWFNDHTFHADDWSAHDLAATKVGQRVAVVLPARNEQATVGAIVRSIQEHLVDAVGLVDEVIVMDSRSTDGTADAARHAGASVFVVDELLPALGQHDGKGEAMWKSLGVTDADLIVFIDADLQSFAPHYITGLLGPLLTCSNIDLVKAAYDRALVQHGRTRAFGGGRVTELTARPLLNAHWPELAGILQPLAGEYAARRELLEQLPFACGYGVEIGMLIDILQLRGLDAIAQVDLGQRIHRNRDDRELVNIASAVVQALARRLPGQLSISSTVTRFERNEAGFAPIVSSVPDHERPPFVVANPSTAMAS
jgi:glucosyl-3-phosphoglycerate synthase